jgi:hypothetical protein
MDRFEAAWDVRCLPAIGDYLEQVAEPLRPNLALDLACFDLERRNHFGQTVDLDRYLNIPELTTPSARARLEEFIATLRTAERSPRGASAPNASADAAQRSGVERIGRYPVHRQIDSGGQADAYLGLHPGLGRLVVLKWLKPALAADPEHGARLAREARLLAGLDHPNIVRVHDLDIHEGRPFLALEHVEGRTLEGYAHQERPGPVKAAEIISALARALARAHEQGITHQDVNPRNVLIDQNGIPRLIDFGLAWYQPAWATEDPLNTPGGRPGYLSPEQAAGRSESIGPATDVFGLGGVLYFLLTGQALYSGKTRAEIFTRAETANIDWQALGRADAPPTVKRLCRRALSADPAVRPTARQLASSLAARNGWHGWLFAAVSGLVLAAGMVGGWRLQRVLMSPATAEDPSRMDLAVRLWRPKVEYLPLREGAPATTGDEVQVRFRAPAGMHAALFSVNGRGELRGVQSYEPRRESHWAVYPGSGQTSELKGPAGTELLFVVARRGGPVLEEEVRALWNEDSPWPGLDPPKRLLRLRQGGVTEEGEKPRDLGAVHHRPEADSVLERLERFAGRLRKAGVVADGLAFRHD